MPVTVSLFLPASAARCPGLTATTVLFEHLCALHYTLTRLPCKHCSMDKSVLAHHPFHFVLREETEGRYFFLGFHSEMPGLASLVYFSHAIFGGIRGVEHRDCGSTSN